MSSYKFRILIDTADQEEIFRDISIADWENFETLYQAIVQAFDFRGDQLASFYVSNDRWDKGHEIALMDMGTGSSLDSPSIMKETLISEMISSKDQRFLLVYDFLKMWIFMIELVEVNEENLEVPQLDLSVGEAPDEDSKELDLNSEMDFGTPADLGNDIDDIFSEFEDGDDDQFENLDDYDL